MASADAVHSRRSSHRLAGAHRGGPTDPSHDEDLRRGILRTDVSRRGRLGAGAAVPAARSTAMPIGQVDPRQGDGDESVLLDLFRHAPTRENIRQFEDDLDKASTASEYVQPADAARADPLRRLRQQARRWSGAGGWLFYAPGITAVGGPAVPRPRRARGARARGARRRRAARLARSAARRSSTSRASSRARGIRLVLFPVPDKASAAAASSCTGARATAAARPARNPDARRASRPSSRAAGVLVFDPTPAALEPGDAAALPGAGHALDAGVDGGGRRRARARSCAARGLVPPPGGAARRGWKTVARTVSRVGDIDRHARLPEGQTLFAPEVADRSTRCRTRPARRSSRATEATCCCSATASPTCSASSRWAGATSAGLGAAARPRARSRRRRDRAERRRRARHPADAARRARGRRGSPGRQDAWSIWELASRELAVGDFKPIDWSALAAREAARDEEARCW